MPKEFSAIMSKEVVMITSSVVILLLVVAVFLLLGSFRTGSAPGFVSWILRGFGLVILLGVFLSPLLKVRSYSVTKEGVEILRWGGKTTVAAADITSVEINAQPLQGSIRLFGNGGLWSYSGKFSSDALGPFRCYLSDPSKGVVIRRHSGVTLVVSPSDPQKFVSAVQSLTSKAL